MSKREVWVVEFKRRKLWQIQITFDSWRGARRDALTYLREFRETNPGVEAKATKYVPETK